jgi:hypothetical protein
MLIPNGHYSENLGDLGGFLTSICVNLLLMLSVVVS